jgi:hypothetical protein
MATIAENLLALQETKEKFKTAFAEKEVDVSNTPFTEYPNKFSEIKTSEDLDAELNEQETLLAELEEDVNALSDKDDTALKILDGTLESFDNNKFGLTSLRDYQFQNFANLKKIDLTGITKIGKYAFENCYIIEQFKIDRNTTAIGDRAFHFEYLNVFDCDFNFISDNFCSVGSSAFSYSNIKSIKGTFSKIGESALAGCESLKDVEIEIRGTIDNYFLANCKNLEHLKLNLDGLTSTKIGNYFAQNCGLDRLNPENNVFVFDMRKTSVTTTQSGIFRGDSQYKKLKYYRCLFPSTLTSIGSNGFYYTDGFTLYLTTTTPITVQSNLFTNSTNYKIFVPYNSINAYKVATNWVTHASYIYGWSEENTFEQGVVLPTTSDEGLNLTWYGDENMTIQVTSVSDPSQIYYCVASEVQ